MPELTEIDATKKVSFEDPKKDAADSDSDSSGVDVATGKGGEGASGVTAEDLSNKARQSRGEKKARKIISKLGLKQVRCRKLLVGYNACCSSTLKLLLVLDPRSQSSDHSQVQKYFVCH